MNKSKDNVKKMVKAMHTYHKNVLIIKLQNLFSFYFKALVALYLSNFIAVIFAHFVQRTIDWFIFLLPQQCTSMMCRGWWLYLLKSIIAFQRVQKSNNLCFPRWISISSYANIIKNGLLTSLVRLWAGYVHVKQIYISYIKFPKKER